MDDTKMKYGLSMIKYKMRIVRACIYPKDIQRITGRSECYRRKILNDIKAHFGKESYQFITAEEFAEYSGIKEEIVNQYLEQVCFSKLSILVKIVLYFAMVDLEAPKPPVLSLVLSLSLSM